MSHFSHCALFYWLLLVGLLSACQLKAEEIVPLDLTGEKTDVSSAAPTEVANTPSTPAPTQTPIPHETPPKISSRQVDQNSVSLSSSPVQAPVPTAVVEENPEPAVASTKPLLIEIPQLLKLRKIAQSLGGDLRISIEPVGLTSEDLIIPLAQSGAFTVSSTDRGILVVGKEPGVDPSQLPTALAQMEQRRRALLNDLAVLESLEKMSQQSTPSKLDSESVLQTPTVPITVAPCSASYQGEPNTQVVVLSPHADP